MLIRCPECDREVSETALSCPGCGYVLKAAAPSPAGSSTERQILIEQRIANEGPSTAVAYLLWFFLGGLGVHRFYLGRTGSGVIMLILTITVIGFVITFIWWIVDAFLIAGILREKRAELRRRLQTPPPANTFTGLDSYHDPVKFGA